MIYALLGESHTINALNDTHWIILHGAQTTLNQSPNGQRTGSLNHHDMH